MINENIIQEMITNIKNVESMKMSYTETLKKIFDDIELSIDGISDVKRVLTDVQDYASISRELSFLAGFEAGIRLSNLLNKL